jgi:hypothetical protein
VTTKASACFFMSLIRVLSATSPCVDYDCYYKLPMCAHHHRIRYPTLPIRDWSSHSRHGIGIEQTNTADLMVIASYEHNASGSLTILSMFESHPNKDSSEHMRVFS